MRNRILQVFLVLALVGFESFNYSSTEYALQDFFGSTAAFSIRWSILLAIAFCSLDFAGVARLYVRDAMSVAESWYVLGAWLLAATMNAGLTWWSVTLAIHNHQTLTSQLVGKDTMVMFVPVFIAVLVWLIRILLIGSFVIAGEQRPAPTISLKNLVPRTT